MTRIITLEYHDVVDAGDFSSSGFTQPGADSYKLTTSTFDEHLAALAATGTAADATAEAVVGSAADARRARVILTFDDGGRSALTEIAPRLEARGWRGHFFMTSSRVGAAGFLGADDGPHDLVGGRVRRGARGGEGGEMLVECGRRELVRVRARLGEATRREISGVDDVVVLECDDSRHGCGSNASARRPARIAARRLACRFHRRYFVSQGCPHSCDGRAVVGIGWALPLTMRRNVSASASRLSSSTRCWITMCDSRTSSKG